MTTTPDTLTDSTICAISTPAGVGGIAVARLSGPKAPEIAAAVWKGADLTTAASHTAHFGTIVDPRSGEPLDQAVATIFRAPRSFTGEDVVEFSVHGSRWVQSQLIDILLSCGAELAGPGGFTRRAFANGRLDLAEAEAVADLIASDSRAAHRVAVSQLRGGFSRRLAELRVRLLDLAALLELELDFSEEDVEFASRTRLIELTDEILDVVSRLADSFRSGNVIKNGVPVAIVGETNSGKSSLLNALVGDDRAIVSDIRGTTRDTIDETLDIRGVTFRLTDTAGIRETDDPIEAIGVTRAIEAARRAAVILWTIDTTADPVTLGPIAEHLRAMLADNPDIRLLIALNKIDLPVAAVDPLRSTLAADFPEASIEEISALTRHGLDRLTNHLYDLSGVGELLGADSDAVVVTNARHHEALRRARTTLTAVATGLRTGLSADFIAQDLRESLHHLGTITGAITTPDILATIFCRFCIGK